MHVVVKRKTMKLKIQKMKHVRKNVLLKIQKITLVKLKNAQKTM